MEKIKQTLFDLISNIFRPQAEIVASDQLASEYKIRITWKEYYEPQDKVRPVNPVIITFQDYVLDDLINLPSGEFQSYLPKIARYIGQRLVEYEAGIDRGAYTSVQPFYIDIPAII